MGGEPGAVSRFEFVVSFDAAFEFADACGPCVELFRGGFQGDACSGPSWSQVAGVGWGDVVGEELVDLSGDEAFEAADDVSTCFAFRGATFRVGPSGLGTSQGGGAGYGVGLWGQRSNDAAGHGGSSQFGLLIGEVGASTSVGPSFYLPLW